MAKPDVATGFKRPHTLYVQDTLDGFDVGCNDVDCTFKIERNYTLSVDELTDQQKRHRRHPEESSGRATS